MSTELFKKLKINITQKMLILNPPAEFTFFVAGLKYDAVLPENPDQRYDYVQLFATSQNEMENEVIKLGNALKYDCTFWICYPKGGGTIKSDIRRDTVWKALELIHLRPVTQVAIDETWSALRGRPHEMVGK